MYSSYAKHKIFTHILNLYATIFEVFNFVDAYEPMFSSVSFFKNVQLEVLVSYFCITYAIISRWFAWKVRQVIIIDDPSTDAGICKAVSCNTVSDTPNVNAFIYACTMSVGQSVSHRIIH